MTKKYLIRELKTKYSITKANRDFDFEIEIKNKVYSVLFINTPVNSQITINSDVVWEIAKGKLDGIRYIKKSSIYLRLDKLNELENKIIFISEKPFRILRHLNESDVEDVTTRKQLSGIHIFTKISDFELI